MRPPVPRLEDYGITKQQGFLPPELPAEKLQDPYYSKWEAVVTNLQALILSRRLHGVVKKLPILSTAYLHNEAEWRRAYMMLAFMTHGYIWGGDMPEERVPQTLSIPLLQVCEHLELPPVATYAGLCLWNFKPIFHDEPIDSLENLSTLLTFTGSLDESWFYLVSVAIEARGAPLLQVMLDAMTAARNDDSKTVISALQVFAERLDELGSLLVRMYENCDPHVFYHRIRPFLAGSKNMAEAGLPNGVLYEDGSGTETYRQYGGGSNAQSSLIQFFDIVLGVNHRPTGQKSAPAPLDPEEPTSPPAHHNFILDMRKYMPGPHARFLQDVSAAANIRDFVVSHPQNRPLTLAYDACLGMLRALRDKHIRLVSRYIIIKSRESRSHSRSFSPRNAPQSIPSMPQRLNLATASRAANAPAAGTKGRARDNSGSGSDDRDGRSHTKSGHGAQQRGTGGTALLPFLKQARDETGEPAIDDWAKRLLGDVPVKNGARRVSSAAVATTGPPAAPDVSKGLVTAPEGKLDAIEQGSKKQRVELGKWGEHADGVVEVVGLAGTWGDDNNEGGLCHW